MIRHFFIYRDDQREGPFSLEELKEKSIQPNTWIWHEGLSDWVKATEVQEVTDLLFQPDPPKLKRNPPVINRKEELASQRRTGSRPSTIIWILGIALFLSLAFSAYLVFNNQGQSGHVANLEKALADQDTIINNQRDSLEQLQNELQQQKMAAQAAQRQANLATVGTQYDSALENLNQAKTRLKEAQSFHLLRSSSDRDQQVEAAQSAVDHWAKAVDSLNQLKAQLGN